MDAFDRFCLYLDDLSGGLQKTSSVNPAVLPDRDFAVVVRNGSALRRAFPLTDRSAAQGAVDVLWSQKASALFPRPILNQARTKVAQVASVLGLSVPPYDEREGVRIDWKDIDETPSGLQKQSSADPEEEPLTEWYFAGGGAMVKISSIPDLRQSESYYANYRSEMSPLDAFRWVEGLADAYAQTDMEAGPALEKLSSTMIRDAYLVPNPDGPGYLRTMAEKLPDLEKTAMLRLANDFESTIQGKDSDRREKLAQIAQAVQDVYVSIGRPIQNPSSFLALAAEDALTFSHQKVSSVEDPVEYTDRTYTLRKSDLESIAEIPVGILSEYLPEDAVEEIVKEPVAVFKSLPSPIRSALASMIHRKRYERDITYSHAST